MTKAQFWARSADHKTYVAFDSAAERDGWMAAWGGRSDCYGPPGSTVDMDQAHGEAIREDGYREGALKNTMLPLNPRTWLAINKREVLNG